MNYQSKNFRYYKNNYKNNNNYDNYNNNKQLNKFDTTSKNKVKNKNKNTSEKDNNKVQPRHFLIKSNVIIPLNDNILEEKNKNIKKDLEIKSIDDENDLEDKDSQDKEDKKSIDFKINREKAIDIIENNKIETIQDIIKISKLYEDSDFAKKNYSFNVEGLYKMIKPLENLDNMIGLLSVKKQIVDQILYFSQEFHQSLDLNLVEKKEDNNDPSNMKMNLENMLKKIILINSSESNNTDLASQKQVFDAEEIEVDKLDMFHTVIQGPPGVGKTELGKIISKIYSSLGITKNNKFKIVNRQNLVGEYLGHTAIKTQNVIDSCLGGVLFIDEAYSLGSGDSKKDSYSKECIDTINQNLSEKKGKFICIIAGYEEELEKDFFSVNPGLKRRFSFKYTINKYSPEELTLILLSKIKKIGWILDVGIEKWLLESKFLNDKVSQFPNFGGDIETWLLNIKIEHSKRVFGLDYNLHKIINKQDIVKGYERYLEHRNIKMENNVGQMYL